MDLARLPLGNRLLRVLACPRTVRSAVLLEDWAQLLTRQPEEVLLDVVVRTPEFSRELMSLENVSLSSLAAEILTSPPAVRAEVAALEEALAPRRGCCARRAACRGDDARARGR